MLQWLARGKYFMTPIQSLLPTKTSTKDHSQTTHAKDSNIAQMIKKKSLFLFETWFSTYCHRHSTSPEWPLWSWAELIAFLHSTGNAQQQTECWNDFGFCSFNNKWHVERCWWKMLKSNSNCNSVLSTFGHLESSYMSMSYINSIRHYDVTDGVKSSVWPDQRTSQ